ncbi:MAG TPA: EAL domain-containing protein [Gammaproteobacteria bacterium]|nr:EAL domain-containing protein [Gammaproteobacteria bacterium]
MHDLPGYELEELLHGSDSSTVHRARRLADGAPVTVKQTSGKVVSARQFTRYRNEFELLRSLTIDGVSRAYELLQHDGRLALVLEHFPGAPLRKWRTGQAFDLVEALDIAIEVGTTLGRVHAAGVIHKDVTSQNIIYDPEARRAKLVDFGLATRLRTESIDFQHPRALEGTLAYMAPEQTGRMNRNVDHRADLYSFGVTLYELFSGVRPHESDDPLELVHFHIARQPVPLAELDAETPASVSAVVMKLLRKAPEDRYQSAAGVVADLRRCRDEIASGNADQVFELGSADVIDRFEPPQKLYGREPELSNLLGAFDRVAAGSKEILLVSGRAGIGKTSLVNDIHRPVTTKRGYFAAGKFDPMIRDRPFSALVDALHDLVEQLLTESPEVVEVWREAIRQALGSNGRVLVDVIPALEHITGAQPPVRPLPSVEAVNRFQLVFQSFVQVFAKREHPLVLFLDDMQWADAASLNLVTLLLGSPATESLLVVEAYREEEVQTTHPLLLAAKELGSRGVHIGAIELAPLAVPDVVQLLADTLHAGAESQKPLADVVHARTGGNPFFIRQFLQSLHEDGLIAFDPASRSFGYDLNAINRATISENVAEVLTSKLDRLGPDLQRALKLAAAIGSRFELSTLAVIYGCAENELAGLLERALETALIVPASRFESLDPTALDSPLVYRRFAFLHDRVQRAAYEMVLPEERPGLHLEIGRLLLADSTSEAALERRLFDIINHMNQGIELIEAPAERLRLADLNLRAGRKAKDSTAYSAAVRSFEAAVALLGGEHAWRDHYELARDAYVKLAESLALSARYDEAFRIIDAALVETESLTERAKLLALKINTHLSQGQMADALRCGRQGAEILGVDLPVDAASLDNVLQAEIGRILERTDEIGVGKLLDLPVMQDNEKIALMSLLTHCLPAAFQTDQQLFALMCCKMVSLSLDFGNCPLSARAYGSFGAILSGGLRKYRAAYRFTKLGIDLAHHFDDLSVLSGVYFLHGHFASHWNEPVDASIELFQRSMQYGLETGDHPHVTYSAARRVSHLLFRGMTLPELRDETLAALELCERIGERTNVPFLEPHLRFVDWLRGERPAGDTLGDARQCEDEHTAAGHQLGNFSFESDWFTMLLMHRFFCGEFEEAYAFSLRAEKLLAFSAGFITRSEHGFYSAMTAAAMLESVDAATRPELESVLARNRADLAGWAENCPENFIHMHELVEAEMARLDGETMTAMRFYDRAIASASRHGFIHIEALAAERAAGFWLGQDKSDFAAHYLDKAIQSYEIWGAAGKAADLRAEQGMHARSIVPSSSVSTSGGTTRHSAERGDALDLATMLKASLAIANELILESLLAKLMNIILENAGGESVVLVLECGGQYMVQGIKESAAADARLMIGESLPDSTALSPAIANYVIRTGEPVVLADPASRGRFRADEYVRRHAPKSVLCAPILHKGKVTGLIYLENNQVAGVFTPARLEALTLLLSQIAVSLENATLYARQEEQARRIEHSNETLKKEVGERKHAEEELSRYKDQLEDLVGQRTRELAAANEELAASNEQVRALAYQDGLTGLPNRRLLNEYLERTLARSRRKSTEFALLFVDLDNFKLINDTIGHQAADEVLNAFSRTLGDLIRDDDILGLYAREVDPDTTVTSAGFTESALARLGGDEFVILLPEIRNRFAAGSVAQRILQRLERPFAVAGTEALLATSIGIATYPADGQTAEELLRNADTAMYHAKQRGKAGYQYYSSEMNAASVERLRIETGLRRALDECQLEVHFQPQLDISTGRLCGAEALLRWRDPERGYVPPSTFIPIAEDSALILQLGEWVLNSACAQAVDWQRAGMPPIPVAVNVSGIQFRRQDICDLARRALVLSGLPAECLWLEITETSLMSIQDRALSLLNELRGMGIRIALDDFGTGYSSLSYLKSLPIDMVKIDRTFTAEALSDARTASIIEAVIAMTRALGLPVLAEGVETSEQLDLLRRLGCSKAQGHLFSAAVPAESFAVLLGSAAQTASQRRLAAAR